MVSTGSPLTRDGTIPKGRRREHLRVDDGGRQPVLDQGDNRNHGVGPLDAVKDWTPSVIVLGQQRDRRFEACRTVSAVAWRARLRTTSRMDIRGDFL